MQNGSFTISVDSGQFTDTPAGDVGRRIHIGMAFTAGCTAKNILPANAALAASCAGFGHIGWIDAILNSGTHSFILDKAVQLTERPAIHHAIEILGSHLGSRPDAREPLQPDCAALVHLRFANESFARACDFHVLYGAIHGPRAA